MQSLTTSKRSFYPTHKTTTKLLVYSSLIAFFCLSDGIMAYFVPVYLQEKFDNSFLMGIVISFSSVVGIMFDVLFSNRLRGASYRLYLAASLICAVFFPLIFIAFGDSIFFIILAIAIWGIYFELMDFSHFHFINELKDTHSHAKAWGSICTFKSISYAVGPLIASLLISFYFKLPAYIALGLLIITIVFNLIFTRAFPYKPAMHTDSPGPEGNKSKIDPVAVWLELFMKIWPLWLLIFCIYLIDASFWTIGALFSEELKTTSSFGELFLTVYMLPSLFIPLLSDAVSKPFGKKRAAFLSALLCAVLLVMVGFTPNTVFILVLVFTSSVFGAFAIPEILATFEDYMVRLGTFGDTIVGIERSAENFGYIIGPVLAGLLAVMFDYQKVFSIMGIVLLSVSILCLFIVPRKIRLPQKKLLSELNDT